MNQTEKEVFGDVGCPAWAQYIYYKIHSKSMGKTPAPPAVWICFQTLMLIDGGHLDDVERKEAEEALNELGWECKRNTKGLLVLHPLVN